MTCKYDLVIQWPLVLFMMGLQTETDYPWYICFFRGNSPLVQSVRVFSFFTPYYFFFPICFCKICVIISVPMWTLHRHSVWPTLRPLRQCCPFCISSFALHTLGNAARIYGLQSGCELQDNQSWRCLKSSRSALIWVYVPIALVLINIQRGYITAQPTPRPLRAWQEREPSGCGEWEVDLC